MSESSININAVQVRGNNLGTGYGTYSCVNPFNTLNFKSLVGAGTITISGDSEQLIISGASSTGEANTGTNVGTGAQVFKDKSGTVLRFKTLLASGSVGITTVGDEIFISAGTESLAAGSITEIQYNTSTGNTLGASSGFTFSAATQSVTIGTRSAGASGYRSFTQGNSNKALGDYSHAGGQSTSACGYASFTHGHTNSALGNQSAILGGCNNTIAIGNTNAAIVGGNAINLTGTTYIDTTAVGNLAIMNTPSSGGTNDVLTLDSLGRVTKVTQASISSASLPTAANGLSIGTGGEVILGGTLTGNTRIDGGSSFGLTLGDSSSCASGKNSLVVGCDNTRAYGVGSFAMGYKYSCSVGDGSFAQGSFTCSVGNYSHASGCYVCSVGNTSQASGNNTCSVGINSHAEGNGSRACGSNSHAEGRTTIASGASSHAEGCGTHSNGNYSHAEGRGTRAYGTSSHSEGCLTRTYGASSHAGGTGINPNFLIASGASSFNHSQNTTAQTAGYGANADNSAILGGINHNIETGNTGATIIGGNTIKLTGTTYIDTTAVGNLAIMTLPTTGSSDQVLIRNATTGKVEYVSKASIGGTGGTTNPAGVDTQIQFNDAGSFGANSGFTFSASTQSITIGTRSGTTEGVYSFTSGKNNSSTGNFSSARGWCSVASGYVSHAEGLCALAIGTASHAEGRDTRAYATNHVEGRGTRGYGQYSHAEGWFSKSCGIGSHAEGNLTQSVGNYSHAEGQCAIASGASSHAEGFCAISIGDFSHAQGNRTKTYGSGSHSGGLSFYSTKPIISCNIASFNHSYNNNSQTVGYGALAYHSAILGGLNHNIAVGNTNAAIIGGNAINLTGTTYIDTTAVSKLAVMNIPTSAAGLPSGMIWSSGGTLQIVP